MLSERETELAELREQQDAASGNEEAIRAELATVKEDPAVTIPDRDALGMDSHFAAARGAYLIRKYDDDKPRMGTVFVQGTSTTATLVKILPDLDAHIKTKQVHD